MKIDNFKLISNILNRKQIVDDNFFFLQILKRKKDNPTLDVHVINVENFYIKNAEHLLEKEPYIKSVCDFHNARAYIRLNVRSKKKTALKTLSMIAQSIESENYDIKNAFSSACGVSHSDENKTWVIDIDYATIPDTLYNITTYIYELLKETKRTDMIITVPTKNGIHLITPPFNKQKFFDKYKNIDIHGDNPTLLYG